MKFYSNKFFISFLILTVLLYGFSVEIVEAKGVATILTAVLVIVAVVFQQYWVPLVLTEVGPGAASMTGAFMSVAAFGTGTILPIGAALTGAVACLEGLICGGGGSDGGAGVSALQVDVRVNGSDGPVEFIAPANFKVQWAISGPAESCSATGNWSGSITNVAGKAEISNVPIGNYSYGIRCTGAGQSASDSVIVNVVSPLPAIDFKGPDVVEIPDSITLFWATERAGSLMASGDWSGSKQVGPLPYKSETFTKPRGSYTFILAASNSSGGSATSQVNTRVIQVPRCAFSADPVSIIPPKYSTLSWSCQYADACSIDQGIGSVNPVSGTKSVRPSQTTTYTLTCSGLDGSRSYQTTVNVGFTPKLREIIPR